MTTCPRCSRHAVCASCLGLLRTTQNYTETIVSRVRRWLRGWFV